MEKPTIEHLVISGGSLSGWGYLGILRKSHEDGFWNIQNIKTIYGTSMGGILAVFVSLLKSTPYTQNYLYDWEMLEDYFVKRPWHTVFKMDLVNIMNSFQNRGIFGISIIQEMYAPLFKALDISLKITFRELFEITQTEVHLFAIELADFKLVDFSYKTHPDWSVIEVIYCSACIPFLFSPYKHPDTGIFYTDGGFLLNYPLRICLENCIAETAASLPSAAEEREEVSAPLLPPPPKTAVFGINRKETDPRDTIDDQSSLFDYVICIFHKIMSRLGFKSKHGLPPIPDWITLYEVNLDADFFSLYRIFQTTLSIQLRIDLLEIGKKTWKKWFS
jgi:predicted acylesterase/phospholipase RssA